MEKEGKNIKGLIDMQTQPRITTFWANIKDKGIPQELVLNLKMLSNTNPDIPVVLYYDEKNSKEEDLRMSIEKIYEEHQFKKNVKILPISDLFEAKRQLINISENDKELSELSEVKKYYEYCIGSGIGAAIASNSVKLLSLSLGNVVVIDSGLMPTTIPVDFNLLKSESESKDKRFLIGSVNEGESLGYCIYSRDSLKLSTISKYLNSESIDEMKKRLEKIENKNLGEDDKKRLEFQIRDIEDYNFILIFEHYTLSDLTTRFEKEYGNQYNPEDLDDFFQLYQKKSLTRNRGIDFIKEEPEELFQAIYNKVMNRERREFLDYQNDNILHRFFEIQNLTHRESWRNRTEEEREFIKCDNSLKILDSVTKRVGVSTKKDAFQKIKSLNSMNKKNETENSLDF